MKLWIAASLSLILSAAAVALGPWAIASLSIGNASFSTVTDLNGVGTILDRVLIGSVVYSALVTALLALALILEAAAARDILRFAASSGQHLLRKDWETAFSGESLGPARHRIVAQIPHPNDVYLLLRRPFSSRRARTEFRAIYFHRLLRSQVWSVVCGLLLCVLLVPLSSEGETALTVMRPIILGIATVIATLAVCWMAVTIATEALISALAEAPFLVKSTLTVPFDSRTEGAADGEHVASAIAASKHTRIETTAVKLDNLFSAALERSLRAHLPEIIVPAMSEAFQGCIEHMRPAIEKILAAGNDLRLELPARIAEALQSDLRQISAEQIQERRVTSGSIIVEQRAIGEKAEELRRTIAEQHELQFALTRRLATDLAQLGPGLLAALREASQDATEEISRDARRTAELMESMEAYAASLLPAIKRLETYDERVLRTMNQASETLFQLTTAVNELSGMVEALRVQLGHAPVRSGTVPLKPSSFQTTEHEIQNGQSNLTGLTAELRSLLDDLDDEHDAG